MTDIATVALLKARIAELRRALEPFAKEPDPREFGPPSLSRPVTQDDFDRAKAVWAQDEALVGVWE